MRIFLVLICSLALASVGLGAEKEKKTTRKKSAARAGQVAKPATQRAAHAVERPVRTQRAISAPSERRSATRSVSQTRTNRAIPRQSTRVRSENVPTASRQTAATRQRARVREDENVRTASRQSAAIRQRTPVQNANVRTASQQNVAVRNRAAMELQRDNVRNQSDVRGQRFARQRRANAVVTNNWRGERFSGQRYSAFRNYRRQYHDRDWWHSHHSRIVFYFGAPYYWDTGYWYPAWGYYPGYTYQYDGPIYGYNGLAPDQVVIDVQVRLQEEGYYQGAVDGTIGPLTRQALADYQADHGLAVTAAVDESTLATMGLS
jgi:hypothetical protein